VGCHLPPEFAANQSAYAASVISPAASASVRRVAGEEEHVTEDLRREACLRIADATEGRLAAGIHDGNLGFPHDGLPQGAHEHVLGGAKLGMFAHPFIKSFGDCCFPRA